ncbi:hypothetical protein CHLRE_14g616750v5 [Chlamydomonas reinhardtii]|uniref:Uncharacterized protein n=1 Tax=Chlamydomonas reinhardtii TaxID=3055 RepID=A8HNS4_CHLRE|nr:uncharacterized protein CHLRE_14g616750v5 [Chlamydomonas reinhardtii]PNW73046.1 hypothetical protein CHLRE_14g616750v5 [Chlamydomonas reinhardtii]|eukprot:XP_001690276.1 peroxisomal targeting signal 1 receptor [Chlamydomonas reinhardtii]
MSALRDLVAGSDMCTPSDGAGPSNAMGNLVNTLLGGAGKTQEQLRELPGVPGGAGPSTSYARPPPTAAELALAGGAGMQVPGLGPPRLDHAAAESFMAAIHGPVGPRMGAAGPMAAPAEWDAIFHGQAAGPTALHPPPGQLPGGPPGMMGAPPPMLAPHFHAFMRGALRAGAAGPAASVMGGPPLPPELAAQLSTADKVRIRDRSTIMARHLYADHGDRFADMQVGQLLASLRIDPRELPAQLNHAHPADWHEAWRTGAQAAGGAPPPSVAAELAAAGGAAAAAAPWEAIWNQRHGPPGPSGMMVRAPSTGWASEFAAQHPMAAQGPPLGGAAAAPGAAWATEFAGGAAAPADTASAWAADFKSEQDTATAPGTQGQAGRTGTADPRATTAALADVLSKSADPKMRNSKFLQFVSKMSKGELMFEDNKVVERTADASAWASEFGQQHGMPPPQAHQQPAQWANEFTHQQARPPQQDWADEFAKGVADLKLGEGMDAAQVEELEAAWRAGEAAAWAEEFNKGDEGQYEEWERIYGHGAVGDSVFGGGLAGMAGTATAPGEYVFSEANPFLGDPEAMQKGKDLFRRGVLSEAALALEAVVREHPENAEAWRLLGTVHAENDDDRQAIAAMMRAHQADPRDPAVLLALGVSHTNELSAWEATKHLKGWLAAQRAYAPLVEAAGEAPDSSQRLSHTIKLFEAAAATAPTDPELHVALGVLHHLGRAYGPAVEAFERALQLRPGDYSLWNKLGATLANNGRSGEALAAYQKALDLKPNYMRAWTNMGISYANLGVYNRSAAFYVRALGLNAAAEHVWGYLRTSLACAGKLELMGAVDAKDLTQLQAALPLE